MSDLKVKIVDPIVSRLSSLWEKVPQKVKEELESALQTFLAVFLFELGVSLQTGVRLSDKDAVLALVIAAVRFSLKATYASLFPKPSVLGGQKVPGRIRSVPFAAATVILVILGVLSVA